jgi:hypothetical protein
MKNDRPVKDTDCIVEIDAMVCAIEIVLMFVPLKARHRKLKLEISHQEAHRFPACGPWPKDVYTNVFYLSRRLGSAEHL